MADGPSKDELVEIFKSLKTTQKGNKVRHANTSPNLVGFGLT